MLPSLETGFEADLALYHLGLGHVPQIEHIRRPSAKVFGDKFDFEMVYGINVGEYHLEDFPWKFFDGRRHAVGLRSVWDVCVGWYVSGWSVSVRGILR